MYMRRGLLVAIGIIILLALAGGVWWVKNKTQTSTGVASKNLGGELYEAANPLDEKLPETNPFAVETNPIKAIYPNPFK